MDNETSWIHLSIENIIGQENFVMNAVSSIPWPVVLMETTGAEPVSDANKTLVGQKYKAIHYLHRKS